MQQFSQPPLTVLPSSYLMQVPLQLRAIHNYLEASTICNGITVYLRSFTPQSTVTYGDSHTELRQKYVVLNLKQKMEICKRLAKDQNHIKSWSLSFSCHQQIHTTGIAHSQHVLKTGNVLYIQRV
jgi:hypothetical protein